MELFETDFKGYTCLGCLTEVRVYSPRKLDLGYQCIFYWYDGKSKEYRFTVHAVQLDLLNQEVVNFLKIML